MTYGIIAESTFKTFIDRLYTARVKGILQAKDGMKMNFTVEKMNDTDWHEIAEIYLQGIRTELATFQSVLPTWDYWNQTHCVPCRFVANAGGKIVGWVALSPISARQCFSGVAEVSIYIHDDFKGMGVGSTLLHHLVVESEKEGFWSLQSVIIKENDSSITLHKKCGFREIGYRERIAQMESGKWHDCVMMERRSKVVGSIFKCQNTI